MKDTFEKIKHIENQIERALKDFELHDDLTKALNNYQEAELELLGLQLAKGKPQYAEQQRVLSYCLMRQGNILRQMEKPDEARTMSEREIAAARASSDPITLARSLMSHGTNLIVTGSLEPGLKELDEARQLFEQGQSYDHRQGLGWYWILQADLANAGLVQNKPTEVIEIATRAMEILLPIENWPGVARAYEACAKAHEKLGNKEAAQEDRQQQGTFENID